MHSDDGHDHSDDPFCTGDGRVMLSGFMVSLSDQIGNNAQCMAAVSNLVSSIFSCAPRMLRYGCEDSYICSDSIPLQGVSPIRLRRDMYAVVASSLCTIAVVRLYFTAVDVEHLSF